MKLIKVSATWCAPCKALSKSLKELTLPENIELIEIDVDEQPAECAKLLVRGVPTLILQDDEGTTLRRKSGAMTTEQLKEFLDN